MLGYVEHTSVPVIATEPDMLLDVHFRVRLLALALATGGPRTIGHGFLGPRVSLPPLSHGGIRLHGDEGNQTVHTCEVQR